MAKTYQYDAIVVGNHYFSYLLATLIRQWKEKVLIVQDPTVAYGDYWEGDLNLSEKLFLQLWGEEWGIDPLINIDRYLIPREQIFFLAGKRVKLSGTPFERLLEVYRKWPSFFVKETICPWIKGESEDFEQKIYTTAKMLAQKMFFLSGYQRFTHQHLQDILSFQLAPLYDQWEKEWGQNIFPHRLNNTASNELLFLIQRVYRDQFFSSLGKSEFYYLWFALFTPSYLFNYKQFLLDWQKLWNLQEGKMISDRVSTVIDGHEKIYIGGQKVDYHFLYYLGMSPIGTGKKYYTPLSWKCQFSMDFFKGHGGQLFRGIFASYLGSEIPYWEIYIEDERVCILRCFYLEKVGSKGSFIQDEVVTLLLSELKRIFFIPENQHPTLLCLKQQVNEKYPGEMLWCKKEEYGSPLYNSFLQKSQSIKIFMGPQFDQSLGKISLLMQLKSQIERVENDT